jgi:hypothetical protein
VTYRPLFAFGEAYSQGYFSNGTQHVATVRVGESDNPPMVYSVVASLSPTPLLPMPGSFEFAFALVEYDVTADEEFRYWSGKDTRSKIVDPEHRELCTHVIGGCLESLLRKARPQLIFMQACDANLPIRAREKYEHMIDVFIEAGYHVERQPAYHGRDSWMMERIDA